MSDQWAKRGRVDYESVTNICKERDIPIGNMYEVLWALADYGWLVVKDEATPVV